MNSLEREPNIYKQEAFITLYVALLSALILVLALALIDVSRGISGRDQKSLRFYQTTEIIKASIYSIGLNDQSWARTVTYNKAQSRMPHVNTATLNAASREIVVLVDANNTVYYDPTVATQGFTMTGEVCNTYSSASVVGGCAIHVDVYWQPFCQAGCVIPPNKIVFITEFFTPNPRPAAGSVPGHVFNKAQTNGIVPNLNNYR